LWKNRYSFQNKKPFAMKKTITTAIIVFATFTAFCQERVTLPFEFQHKNSIQLELFGHGAFYSVNYERILLNGEKFKTTGQAGFAWYPPATDVREFWLPFSINELVSFNQHHVEFGLGTAFTNEEMQRLTGENTRDWSTFLTGRVGYRYQKPEGRFIFRIGFTPLYELDGNELQPWGGVSFGYSF
jgi:hypothetical protein